MSTPQQLSREEFQDGVVQLRFRDFDDNVRDINAAEFAEVLQGLVEFTSDMAKDGLFDAPIAPEVRVRAPERGSFVVEAVLQWAVENPEVALSMATTAGGGIVQALNVGIRRLRGEGPQDFEYLENGNVKVKWQNGTVDEVPAPAWKRLSSMKRRTRESMRKLLAPLGDDADVLEIRTATVDETTEAVLREEPEIVANRADYQSASRVIDDTHTEAETFRVEAKLQSVDFRRGEKWRVQTINGTRLASIEDDDFLLELDRGAPIHKNDIFEVDILETRTTKNDRTTKDWSLVKVTWKRRGEDEDDDESSPSAQVES